MKNQQEINISIITVSYNSEETISNSIDSVLRQTSSNFEYIIIDGNSKDKTLSIIKSYEKKFEERQIRYQWISENDKGIGDAWNKGLKIANGNIIGLLNADDIYSFKTLEIVENALKKGINSKIFYGECKFIKNNEIVSVNNKKFNPQNILRGFGFTHTTCFVPKKVYHKVGNFNTNTKIAVDTEFLLRCYKEGVQFEQLSNITYMGLGGVSDRKAKKAYFEYLFYLEKLKIKTSNEVKKQKVFYSIYYPFRSILRNKYLRLALRQFKHYLVFIYNLIYYVLPSFYLKNLFLKTCGIKIGKKSSIHPRVIFYKWDNLSVGNNTVINAGCRLDNRAKITIGDNVSIAHNTQIYTAGHDINSPYFDMISKEVVIEDYACIFSNCLIMPGVKIGKGAVVYSGSVVTKNIPDYGVVGGNPAKIIGKREKKLSYNLNYSFHKAL